MKLNSLCSYTAALLTIAAFSTCEGVAQVTSYDISTNFSFTSNPSGVWSYGWKSNFAGGFTLLTNKRTISADNGVPLQMWEVSYGQHPVIFHNATTNTALTQGGAGNFPPGVVFIIPGFDGTEKNYGVIRFTVPNGQPGDYVLESVVRPYLDGSASRDADFHVVVNGSELFGQFIDANSRGGYTNSLRLAAGDTVDFMVGRGADGAAYGSGLEIDARLQYVTCTPHRASATATVVNGFVVGVTVTDGGCGYTNAPLVTFQGGGGSGAAATANVAGGVVTAVNITSAGIGYTNAPTVVIASPPFVPTVSISVSKIKVTQNLMIGRRYVLESSTNATTWTPTGPAFVAEQEFVHNEFDVDLSGQYFRIREVP